MRSAFSIAVLSSEKRLVDDMESDFPMSAEEEEAENSEFLNNLIEGYNSDPIVDGLAETGVTGGEEVKSCLPAHVAAFPWLLLRALIVLRRLSYF